MHAVFLLGLPADLADGAARLLLRVLLGAVRAAVAGSADPPVRAGRETGRFHAPVLIRRIVPTDRPVHPGIDGIGGRRPVDRVPVVPSRRVDERLGESGHAIHRVEVREVLRRLVEAAALERTAGMRQVEPLAVVGIVTVRLAVVDRRLVGEDGFRPVGVLIEAGPHAIEADFQSVRLEGVIHDAVKGRDRRRILMRVLQHAALVGACGPRRDSALLPVPRRGRQQGSGGLQIGEDQLGNGIGASGRVGVVGLAIVVVGLEVVGNVAPHAPQLEVIMRAQEERFSHDAHGIDARDLPRFGCADGLQQPNRRVGAHHAFVHTGPLAVQIVLRLIGAPRVQLELGRLRLVGGFGALVGIVSGDAPERPVAGRAAPVAVGGIVAVERAVGGDQRALDADLGRQGVHVQSALRRRVEEVRACVRDRQARQEACRSAQHLETP